MTTACHGVLVVGLGQRFEAPPRSVGAAIADALKVPGRGMTFDELAVACAPVGIGSAMLREVVNTMISTGHLIATVCPPEAWIP